jgi:putative DNA primase/helicase
MAMLRGSGEELKGELLGMGLRFDVRDNKKSLIEYINNQTPNKTIEISTQTTEPATAIPVLLPFELSP